jgi:hypothetical protein
MLMCTHQTGLRIACLSKLLFGIYQLLTSRKCEVQKLVICFNLIGSLVQLSAGKNKDVRDILIPNTIQKLDKMSGFPMPFETRTGPFSH